MLIVMSPGASRAEIDAVLGRVRDLGFAPHEIPGAQRVAIGITGNDGPVDADRFADLRGVADVVRVSKPYKLVGREAKPDDTIVSVGGVAMGGGHTAIMAGPCAVESRDQLLAVARAVKAAGGHILRGGAFKPRTSPYAFQGLKEEGLRLLDEARRETGLPVITEVKDVETLPLVEKWSDILQIGARNMQNFSLLEAVGGTRKPVMLKRGLSATIAEMLMAAEYIMSRGNHQIILCERGIRTFETATRNTLDLGGVVVLRAMSHLPVVVDPSHGVGLWYAVGPLARAAVALGADGVMMEVHPDPAHALSDGPQSLRIDRFTSLMGELRRIADVVGRAWG
ncbi:MAG: 3-deoxy-7-phosphoheptulonate synthase [Deltaproteobacteria bacterium]|nr:3-deoxy-7-phosphoheptulonate synthase [Deltaproteobacteria bacterium]